MHGFTHLRRWATVVVAAVVLFVLSGCTVGYVTIPAGYDRATLGCPPGVDFGPGHVSARPNVYSDRPWHFSYPGTRVRFGVTKSNSTQPLRASIYGVDSSMFGSIPVFLAIVTVWDGSRSTGLMEVIPQREGVIIVMRGPADQPWDFAFVMAAVDANGNETGFYCGSPFAPGYFPA